MNVTYAVHPANVRRSCVAPNIPRSVRAEGDSSQRLGEAIAKARPTDRFDVFLSHARIDEDVVFGTKLELEQFGLSVYVDWVNDPHLDRTKVTAGTAQVLRARMGQCRSLLYAHTENSGSSRWMPWELGYFNALNGRVAILPIAETIRQEFACVEYLGLYPYVDDANGKLWVNRQQSRTVSGPLSEWLNDLGALKTRPAW